MFACNTIENKGKEVLDKTSNKLSEKKEQLVDKVVKHFDAHTPDTKWNKLRFQEFFGFTPPEDVKEIYCAADEMGINQKYAFSFVCNSDTLQSIIKHLKLTPTEKPDNSSEGLQPDFSWWDKEKTKTITPYSYNYKDRYFRLLWYDKENKRVYYLDYDL